MNFHIFKMRIVITLRQGHTHIRTDITEFNEEHAAGGKSNINI